MTFRVVQLKNVPEIHVFSVSQIVEGVNIFDVSNSSTICQLCNAVAILGGKIFLLILVSQVPPQENQYDDKEDVTSQVGRECDEVARCVVRKEHLWA